MNLVSHNPVVVTVFKFITRDLVVRTESQGMGEHGVLEMGENGVRGMGEGGVLGWVSTESRRWAIKYRVFGATNNYR